MLGTLAEIMTKKIVSCSKKIPGHLQDKTLKMVNYRTNSRAKKKIPGHFQDFRVFLDAWTYCNRKMKSKGKIDRYARINFKKGVNDVSNTKKRDRVHFLHTILVHMANGGQDLLKKC